MFMALSAVVIQEVVPDAVRGRVMSLYAMSAGGIMAFANLGFGTAAGRVDGGTAVHLPGRGVPAPSRGDGHIRGERADDAQDRKAADSDNSGSGSRRRLDRVALVSQAAPDLTALRVPIHEVPIHALIPQQGLHTLL